MSEALDRVTQAIDEGDLPFMVLVLEELPDELRGFLVAREDVLDNETMAAHGFPGTTAEAVGATGRIAGYLREFVNPREPGLPEIGSNVIAATVVHLFQDREQVLRWMTEKFLAEFERMLGQELEGGQQLISAHRLQFAGFSDEAVGLHTLQTSPVGLVSSTIVDFRVGRLLGVAYLVCVGDEDRKQMVGQMGIELERRMVRVLLEAI